MTTYGEEPIRRAPLPSMSGEDAMFVLPILLLPLCMVTQEVFCLQDRSRIVALESILAPISSITHLMMPAVLCTAVTSASFPTSSTVLALSPPYFKSYT